MTRLSGASALDGGAAGAWLVRTIEQTNRVHGVTFSRDGTHLATVRDDKTVRVWDVQYGAEVAAPRLHRAGVWSVAFSHDDDRLASGCWLASGGVRTWRTNSLRDR